ncbi:MAG: tRNA pseudouridine(38-40) synthase TruA [Candidatus Saccharicenans sp.]
MVSPLLNQPGLENIKLIISYDGTEYHGWQRQPGMKTIQETIEEAIQKITQEKINLQAAGRTDAGVHALGQVANFKTGSHLPEAELLKALNALLPPDIRIWSVEKVPPSFHARKSAKTKIYRYRIKISPLISPFDYRYVFHFPYPLDLEAMQIAAGLFVREDDFSAFSSNRFRNPVRKVVRSELRFEKEEIIYTIEANGFLHHMVRTIVGTILMVGRKKIKPDDIGQLFLGKKRTLFSPTVPAKGLCLVEVIY